MTEQRWFVGFQNDYPYVIDRAPKTSNDYPDHDADVAIVAKPFEVRGMSPTQVAHLIAGAPELLAALEPFTKHSTSDDTVTITVPTSCVKAARAAMLKASPT